MERIQLMGLFLLEWGRAILVARRWPDDRLFLQAAYRAILRREADEGGIQYYRQSLQRGITDRPGVLRSLAGSNEFKQLHALPIYHLDALHQSRMMLIRQCLPPADVIVDLGGAAAGHREGALLLMGYPHRPREIVVVDLPPSPADGEGTVEPAQPAVTVDGTRVRYVYTSMTDLSSIPDASADLVWSGESIEHVTEEEADAVCREVHRILRPGGCFCLDTPNASLTRIQSPGELIHPEHKKEYHVRELTAKLERWGLPPVEARGICPIPRVLQSGTFSYAELGRNIGLSDNPEEGYLFFLKAVKPA